MLATDGAGRVLPKITSHKSGAQEKDQEPPKKRQKKDEQKQKQELYETNKQDITVIAKSAIEEDDQDQEQEKSAIEEDDQDQEREKLRYKQALGDLDNNGKALMETDIINAEHSEESSVSASPQDRKSVGSLI